jgi:gliding motility-associated-like protein
VSLTVTVKALPNATISGATTICSGNGTTIQFSGTPNAQIFYTINGTAATITLGANSLASLPTGNLAATTTYALVSVTSNETPACTQNFTNTNVVVTVNPTVTPITSFGYGTSICANETTVLPTLASGFTTGGTFTSTTGLVINPTTGALNVASSTKGTYMVTYTITANPTACLLGGTSQFEITLYPEITAEITADCVNDSLILMVNPLNNSFNSNAASYSWKNSSNQTVQTNSTFNVDTYLSQYPSVTFPFTINVEINSNNCLGTTSFTVQNDPCKFIPRGISPNNDGDNDTFDLSGIGVRELVIFNRYGISVYSFSGNYTNQWKGQTDKGENLPTGTYFYNIVKSNGLTLTGWVYINQ